MDQISIVQETVLLLDGLIVLEENMLGKIQVLATVLNV